MSRHSILRLFPIEQQHQWDAFISASPSGHLLQSWGWGELKASAGWHPLRLALWDTQREQIVVAAQVLRRTPLHLPLALGHLAYIPKGPVFDCSSHDVSYLVQTFFSQLHSILIKQGALALQAEFACEVESQDSKSLIRDRFGIHTLEYYLRAWQIFAPRKQARLFLAHYNGQPLAGIFVGLMAKQAVYLYGASSNEQRQLMPNYLLQWEAIRWAKQAGAVTYDFWGIPETDEQSEAMAGVYRFKSGWGGRIVRFLGNYECLYHPLTMRFVRKVLLRHQHLI